MLCCVNSPTPLSFTLLPFAAIPPPPMQAPEPPADPASRHEVWRDFFNVREDRLLYSDESVVAFRDRTPKASTHILVCPRYDALRGAESLRSGSLPLLARMQTVGERVAREQRAAAGLAAGEAVVLGFHRRPLRSVDHLHLHVMVPPFTPAWQRWRYTELGPFGFISLTSVVRSLSAKC